MRTLNIVGGSIVLVCVVAVSYSHTLALFGMGGFTGIFQHMAVIAVEVTFLLGALNMVVSRFKGQYPGIPAIIGGLFGVGVVGWGNIEAGVNYGIHGIVLGAAIPISLIIAEAILSKAILQRMQEGQEPEAKESPKEEAAITNEDPVTPTVAQESPKDHPEVTQDGEPSPKQWEDVQKTAQMIEESPKEHQVPPTGNEESPNHSPTVAQIIEEPPKEAPSTDGDTQESPSDSPKAPTITQAITNEAPNEGEESPEEPPIETDPEKIYAVAWEMYEESGEPPTRRGLAEAVPTSEHRARKAIDRLKEETAQEVVAS